MPDNISKAEREVDRPPGKIVALIQARTSSTRLPGKVLLKLAGEPLLARVVGRVRRAKTLDEAVVATTVEPSDDPIAELCRARGWPCFRGSLEDVLDRYYQAAKTHRADAVVRITADSPMIDPAIIDRVVSEFCNAQPEVQYLCTDLPQRRIPLGLDVEIVRSDALARAWHEDRNPASREHVTPYIYHHPELFRIGDFGCDEDHSSLRWTLDTPEDFELASRIYGHFGHDRFTWRDVLALVQQRPEWQEINRHVKQKQLEA